MQLPSGWTYDRLKFVARLKYGDSLAADTRSPGDIEVFGSNGPVGTHGRANTGGPVILVGRKGSYGKIQYSGKPAFAIDTTFFIDQLSSDAHLRWLFYALQTLGLQYFSQDTGVPGLSREIAENLNIYVPPVEHQKTIARFLDYRTAQLDALIEKKRQLLDKLAEKRSALITRAVTQGLDPDAPMKDSGVPWLGEIPAHWEAMRLGKCLEGFEQGWSPACEDRIADDDEWAVLKAGCVNGGQFNESAHKALPVELEGRPRLQVLEGDVLMCRASGSPGLIGSVARVEAVRQKLMFSDKTYRITLNRRKMRADFFILVMLSKGLRDQIILSISGAEGLANNIAQADVKRYVVAAPPIEEQWRIQRYIARCSERLERHCASISQQVETLTEYRSALITAAVTGQIDVRDWQPPEASAA